MPARYAGGWHASSEVPGRGWNEDAVVAMPGAGLWAVIDGATPLSGDRCFPGGHTDAEGFSSSVARTLSLEAGTHRDLAAAFSAAAREATRPVSDGYGTPSASAAAASLSADGTVLGLFAVGDCEAHVLMSDGTSLSSPASP